MTIALQAMPRGIGRLTAALGLAALVASTASAQVIGVATMAPGSLNHTTGTAIARVAKAHASLNALVQPTAGETVVLAIVGQGEADLGIANALEVVEATKNKQLPNLRLIGAIHPLYTAYFVRKDSPLRTIADLKGKRVVSGFSAQRTLDISGRALLAAGGIGDSDIKPVRVPNVVRGADEFVAGNSDTFFFAFGAPKVREVDATAGGIRVLEVPEAGMKAAQTIFPQGYLARVEPGPLFVGVERPMGVYTWDNLLFTNAKVADDVVYKVIKAMVEHKADLVTVQPALRALTPEGLYKNFGVPYHPGALKYFSENKITVQ